MIHNPADVNERVTEEWKSETTPGERVRVVMKRTYAPQSVTAIAERAMTSETTARKHLDVLTEDGYVEAVSLSDKRGGWYKRAPRSVVLERAQQILRSVDVETLSARVTELRETAREFEEQTGTESPRAAAVANAELNAEEMGEWRTVRRNLKLTRAALALADAADAVGDGARSIRGNQRESSAASSVADACFLPTGVSGTHRLTSDVITIQRVSVRRL